MLFTGRGRFVLGETVLGKILQQVFVFVFLVVCFVCFVFLCEKKRNWQAEGEGGHAIFKWSFLNPTSPPPPPSLKMNSPLHRKFFS